MIDSDLTDVNGDYELTLEPGDYVVVEVLQQGWTQFHPANSVNVIDLSLGEFGHAITLVSGQLDEGNDFGNSLDGGDISILGLKFNDRDGNGEQDVDGADDIPGNADDEVGLEGWTIHLYENKNPPDKLLDQAEFNAGPLLTFVTDDRGIWGGFISDALLETLGVTLPLDLIVVEEQQNGWTQTPVDGPAKLSTGPEFPSSLVLASGLNTGSITLGERGYAIEAIPGNSEVIDVDFGNRQNITKRLFLVSSLRNRTSQSSSVALTLRRHPLRLFKFRMPPAWFRKSHRRKRVSQQKLRVWLNQSRFQSQPNQFQPLNRLLATLDNPYQSRSRVTQWVRALRLKKFSLTQVTVSRRRQISPYKT